MSVIFLAQGWSPARYLVDSSEQMLTFNEPISVKPQINVGVTSVPEGRIVRFVIVSSSAGLWDTGTLEVSGGDVVSALAGKTAKLYLTEGDLPGPSNPPPQVATAAAAGSPYQVGRPGEIVRASDIAGVRAGGTVLPFNVYASTGNYVSGHYKWDSEDAPIEGELPGTFESTGVSGGEATNITVKARLLVYRAQLRFVNHGGGVRAFWYLQADINLSTTDFDYTHSDLGDYEILETYGSGQAARGDAVKYVDALSDFKVEGTYEGYTPAEGDPGYWYYPGTQGMLLTVS